MPDDPTATNAQAANAASTSAQAATTTSSDALAADESISLEEARKLRSEAINLRKREKEAQALLKGYQDKEDAAKLAAMGDLEKANKITADLQAKNAEIEQKLKERIVRSEVALQASALGIAHPEKVYRLIDTDELKFDDATGEPTNAKALIEKLLVEMPELVAQGQQARGAPTTGANNPGRANTTQPGTLPPNTRVDFHSAYSTRK